MKQNDESFHEENMAIPLCVLPSGYCLLAIEVERGDSNLNLFKQIRM